MSLARLKASRILTNGEVPEPKVEREVIYYDNLDAMLMALEAGDIDYMQIPECTADYLIVNNDKLEDPYRSYKYENLTEEEQRFLDACRYGKTGRRSYGTG